MLIDEFLPHYDFSEYHEVQIRGSMEGIYAAAGKTDFASNRVVRLLLALRALPSRALKGSGGSFASQLNLRSAERFGFFIAAEDPPREIVIALQGKFWTVTGGAECATREALALPIAAGTARAVWNFVVRPDDSEKCILATETRILCADAHARRRFRIYWFFVRPGSGIIRRMMLRTIKKVVEAKRY